MSGTPPLGSTFSTCILASLLLAPLGCKKKPLPIEVKLPPQPEYPFQAQAIRLRWTAAADLNLMESAPHPLLLAVYQCSDINPFIEKARDVPGLRTLLESAPVDPAVLAVNRVFVQPGEQSFLLVDRAQGARWLGLAAGYYGLRGPAATRFAPLPSGKQGEDGEFCVDLNLGPAEIRGFTLSAPPR